MMIDIENAMKNLKAFEIITKLPKSNYLNKNKKLASLRNITDRISIITRWYLDLNLRYEYSPRRNSFTTLSTTFLKNYQEKEIAEIFFEFENKNPKKMKITAIFHLTPNIELQLNKNLDGTTTVIFFGYGKSPFKKKYPLGADFEFTTEELLSHYNLTLPKDIFKWKKEDFTMLSLVLDF